MFIELVESLRCVRPHEFSWLVATTTEMVERHIVRGVLGCPACRAEYPIVDAVADFTAEGHVPASPRSVVSPAARPDDVLRAAALLDLESPGGFVVLAGAWGAAAPPLATLLDGGVHLLAIDPPSVLPSGRGVSVALSPDILPVRAEASRGIALDAAHAAPAFVAAAAAALRPNGRLVAPAAVPVPAGVVELARDERQWVGRKESAGALVRLAGRRKAGERESASGRREADDAGGEAG